MDGGGGRGQGQVWGIFILIQVCTVKLQNLMSYSFQNNVHTHDLMSYLPRPCAYVGDFSLCRGIRFNSAAKELGVKEVR